MLSDDLRLRTQAELALVAAPNDRVLRRSIDMVTSTLSDTARAALLTAAEHAGHLLSLPERVPLARRSVARSMLKAGLIEETSAPHSACVWRTSETGGLLALKATPAGLAAVAPQDEAYQARGSDEQNHCNRHDEVAHTGPKPAVQPTAGRPKLRDAVTALLAAWDMTANGPPWLASHFDMLRASIDRPNRASGPRAPRTDTKRSLIITLLGRTEGATVAQVVEATGWARPTVRGFFASLKKKGTSIEVLDRVRQVGPGKQGETGSYTVYRIGEAS